MSEVSNGGISPCEKCGAEDINVAYHKPGCSERDCFCSTCSYGSHNKAHGEHLHYHCRTCHYDWLGPVAGRKTVTGIQR